MLVSVNIPCYNGERFIAEAIQSVLNQTFTDFEIIIVNNGSNDKTEEIIRSFKDSRIKYFYNQKNEGLSKTRNKMLELSSGEFIAFVDHDDLWVSDKLEKQLALFKKNPEIVLVCSDCLIIDANGKHIGKWTDRHTFHRGDVSEVLLACNFIPLSTVILKKSVLKSAGVFMPYEIAADYDLWLKCAALCSFDYVDEPLAKYRVHESNYSKTHPELGFKEALEIYSHWDSENPYVKKGLSRCFLGYGIAMLYQRKSSGQYFYQALKYKFSWKVFLLLLFSFINPLIWSKLRMAIRKTFILYQRHNIGSICNHIKGFLTTLFLWIMFIPLWVATLGIIYLYWVFTGAMMVQEYIFHRNSKRYRKSFFRKVLFEG